jgi:AcrR family transcriptional regulator
MARPSDPQIRSKLLDAAASLLAAGGVDALSIRRVAADVGASTMAVYTHFGSKDDLVRAVVESAFERLGEVLREVPVTDDPLTDTIEAGLAYRRMALADANLYQVMFGRNPLQLGDPAGHGVRLDTDVGLDAYAALVGPVQRCIDAGHFHGDADVIAHSLWALAHGCVSLELAGFLDDRGEDVLRASSLAIGAGFATPPADA